MNIKKIGLTALATSLVASSAYAADVSVSGAAGITFVTENGNTGDAGDHGKGFGTDNSLSFSASGEMDNGWSVSASTAFTDAAALSSNAVTLTMGDMGSLSWGHAQGGNAGSYDDVGAGAYEEVDDGAPTSLSTNLMGTTVDNGGIFYTSPSIDAAGASVTMHVGYTPKVGNADIAGGGASGVQAMGSSQNVGLTLSHESGLTLGAFVNEVSRTSTAGEDTFQGAWYAKYSMGPIALAYGQSHVNNGVSGAADTAGVAKTFAAGTGIFENEQYVVTMNVNDNLSVSYGKADDVYDARAGSLTATTTGTNVADVTMSMKSIQAAYSMGSMSIKAYRLDVDNVGYNNTGGSNQKTEIALGLSF
jgi:outer membrane protein OmpU